MIAPEPFFEPRGTPFSEYHRIRALTALGHEVDLVTYPFGENVSMPGLRVFRSLRPPLVDGVPVGPSLVKLPLDFLLTLSVLRRAMTSRYDAIHSHEEGGLIGVVLATLLRVPHLYDMHSSLPQQLTNFAFSRSRLMRRLFLAIERLMIRGSRVVIVICPSLADTVRAIDPAARTEVGWRRYPGDTYGEHADGSPRDQRGIGRSWPLLVGERAHFELARGNLDEAHALRDRLEQLASATGMLPEQTWDAPDVPDRGLRFGGATHSAAPLGWAHAEYVKLCRSLADGTVFDLPSRDTQRLRR